ncbi:hypothetical protein MAR_017651 [Mya arenaria]|uniref:Uncharacterized protein n=1 Tax=Mya arenaria TaxID=6604 RepID=A0ABY7ECG1_MYAAR|nr:hypothetical protein MAR_017651 [Mya arenaria]
MASEGNLRCARTLLDSASRSLTDHSASVNRIGCASVWNRHKQTREEDCKLILTDLPKECIFEIMLKFTDHRDVVNLENSDYAKCTQLTNSSSVPPAKPCIG